MYYVWWHVKGGMDSEASGVKYVWSKMFNFKIILVMFLFLRITVKTGPNYLNLRTRGLLEFVPGLLYSNFFTFETQPTEKKNKQIKKNLSTIFCVQKLSFYYTVLYWNSSLGMLIFVPPPRVSPGRIWALHPEVQLFPASSAHRSCCVVTFQGCQTDAGSRSPWVLSGRGDPAEHRGEMVLLTMIARLADGLPLAASMQEDEQVHSVFCGGWS